MVMESIKNNSKYLEIAMMRRHGNCVFGVVVDDISMDVQ